MISVKDMVASGKKVSFVRFQNKELWYITETGFEFPVPLDDTAGAVFLAEDRAILYMRWINKYIKALDKAKLEQLTGK